MKALLIIDINDDENIEELRISYKIDRDGEVLYAANDETLKLMPKKKDYSGFYTQGYSEHEERYCEGFNECIDKIVGEE